MTPWSARWWAPGFTKSGQAPVRLVARKGGLLVEYRLPARQFHEVVEPTRNRDNVCYDERQQDDCERDQYGPE